MHFRRLLAVSCSLFLAACSTSPGASTPTAAPTVGQATAVSATTTAAVAPSPTSATRPSPTLAPTVVIEGPTSQILARVAVSRALPVTRAVPAGTLSRDGLREYLIASAEKNNVKQELEKSKALLVALELIKESDDLYSLWLDSLTEQVAGFYEFETHSMKLISSGSLSGTLSTSDEIVLAHEYTHSLQDQHFNLGIAFDQAKRQGERTMALQALSEGDATYSMYEYARQYKTPEQLSEMFGKPARIDTTKLAKAPSVIQSSLLFPYQQGMAFVAGLFQSGGWPAVNAAYSHPPVSTEQILHPDRYQRGDIPQSVDLPNIAPALGSGWQQFDSDTVGELGWLQYLAGSGRPSGSTGGWGGDRYVIFRDGSGKLALASEIVWDNPRSAADFFAAVREAQKARNSTTMPDLSANRISWIGKNASGYAAVDGFQVLLVITPDEATTKKVAARFPGLGT